MTYYLANGLHVFDLSLAVFLLYHVSGMVLLLLAALASLTLSFDSEMDAKLRGIVLQHVFLSMHGGELRGLLGRQHVLHGLCGRVPVQRRLQHL